MGHTRPNSLPPSFLFKKPPRMNSDPEDPADILNDALEFLSGQVVEDEVIKYGDLQLTVAAKEGKANTLLADHLFSPGLFLAERIERGPLSAHKLNVIELGAGCALPSLLLSTVATPPATVVVTDYPDPGILGNLARNVQRNSHLVSPGCTVWCCGYEWGTNVAPLLAQTGNGRAGDGYDMVILSDLLHFHSSHAVLVSSINALLGPSPNARIHVAAGNYTKPEVCDNFLRLAVQAGFIFDEILPLDDERDWLGSSTVSGLDKTALKIPQGCLSILGWSSGLMWPEGEKK
ncbi:hypothetical protein MVEN_00746900 [Mycena venus]|uniref:Nicotinamide N-methyltransferase n=1 Tax=Mycena venus TaxID=2733690 RepID=A0A8H6YFF1_9AGAR|nr:hypothetical protein MVEN_00746900 [Mycena venus]